MFAIEDKKSFLHRSIKVIGIGSAGSNAMNKMIQSGIKDAEFIVVDTDAQALLHAYAPTRTQIGEKIARGLGAQGKPEIGRTAAQQDRDKLLSAMKGTDIAIVVGGLGGGTGTGAIPVIAEYAREIAGLTLGIVTTPMACEGKSCIENAEKGLDELKPRVDACMVVPLEQLLATVDKQMSHQEFFSNVCDIICQAVQGVCRSLAYPADENDTQAVDIWNFLKNAGDVTIGSVQAIGDNVTFLPESNTLSSSFLCGSIKNAQSVALNVFGATEKVSMKSISEAVLAVQELAHPDANIATNMVNDSNLGEKVSTAFFSKDFIYSD